MNEKEHQKFLISDSDDDCAYSLLYDMFIEQVSLSSFYEVKDENPDFSLDNYQQSKIDEKENIYNEPIQNINDSTKKSTNSLISSTSFSSSLFSERKNEATQNSIQKKNLFIHQEPNPEDLLIPSSFFIISDIYYKNSHNTRNEIILRLYTLPYYESNYIVHLKEKWTVLELKVNDPLLIIGSFKKVYNNIFSFKNQNTFSQQATDNPFNFNYETTIDNKNGFVVLWPFFMISATRLSGSVHCMRQSTLISMVPYTTSQPNWILNEGTIAHSLVEDVLTRKVKSTDQIQDNVNNLITTNIAENGPQGISKLEMTNRLAPIANLADQLSTNFTNKENFEQLNTKIKTLQKQQEDNQNQLQINLDLQKKLNEKETEKQIEIQQKIEQQRIENDQIQKVIKEAEKEKKKLEILTKNNVNYPPYDCKVTNNEENLISLNYGYVGKSDLTLFDPKNKKYFPLEMKSGKSANKKAKKHHQIQLSTYVLMMKEMLDKKADDYGMLFYMADTVSLKIQPTFSEQQSFAILRDIITENSMHGQIPPKINDKLNCENCQASDVCKFISDIEDIECGNYKIKTKSKRKKKKKKKKKSKNKNQNEILLNYYETDEILDSLGNDDLFIQNQILLLNHFESLKQGKTEFNNSNEEVIIINDSDDSDSDFEPPETRSNLTLPIYSRGQINFFKKIKNEIMNDILDEGFEQYFNWTLTVSEREKKGIAVNGLEIFSFGNSYFFISDKFEGSQFRMYSKFVLTKNGKPPILNTGMVTDIKKSDKSVIFVSFDRKDIVVNEGESDFCLDLIKFIKDSTFEVHNLFNLFAYSYSNLKSVTSLFIENEKSDFFEGGIENDAILYGLNNDQKRTIRNSIISKEYSIISGCKNSGKTLVLANLINFYESHRKSILVICPSDSSVDKMSRRLLNVLPFAIVRDQEIFLTKSDSIRKVKVFLTNVKDFENSFFLEKKFDILFVDDCERIKMSSLIGPLNSSQKFVLCGDSYQCESDFLSAFSFLNAEKNEFNFLRTKYKKSEKIHNLENSMVYKYSTFVENRTFSELKINLNKLNDFHSIHKNWLIQVLSKPTFFININDANLSVESSIVAALIVSLMTCDVKSKSIGILCFDEKLTVLIREAFKSFLNSFSEFFKSKIDKSVEIDIHNHSTFLTKMKNYKVLIVCFGESNTILAVNEAKSIILRANEKLYLIGNEKKLKINPFIAKLIKRMDKNDTISTEIFNAFNEMTDLFV